MGAHLAQTTEPHRRQWWRRRKGWNVRSQQRHLLRDESDSHSSMLFMGPQHATCSAVGPDGAEPIKDAVEREGLGRQATVHTPLYFTRKCGHLTTTTGKGKSLVCWYSPRMGP
eukprot:Sspe_Gene.106369::Locus_84072_Transcript_1_1_Confidence_1.000_Length_624::g.106369::m.106369